MGCVSKNGSSLLHVGCGGGPLPELFREFDETRLDINPACNPDIVASMLDMGDIGAFDVLLCQHAIEHLYPYQIGKALNEFKRVLNDGGYAVVLVPDLEDVSPTDEVILETEAGPVTGADMYFGLQHALEENPFMAHHTGFVQSTLHKAMIEAGFKAVEVKRIGQYNLMGVGIK